MLCWYQTLPAGLVPIEGTRYLGTVIAWSRSTSTLLCNGLVSWHPAWMFYWPCRDSDYAFHYRGMVCFCVPYRFTRTKNIHPSVVMTRILQRHQSSIQAPCAAIAAVLLNACWESHDDGCHSCWIRTISDLEFSSCIDPEIQSFQYSNIVPKCSEYIRIHPIYLLIVFDLYTVYT